MSGISRGQFEERNAETRMTVEDGHNGVRVLRGVPIVFNSLSRVLYDERIGPYPFREVIAPEAVDRTLRAAALVKALWNHNSDIVLGSTRSGTLALRKASGGLEMTIYPPSWASPQVETVQRGDVDGMSFAFGVAAGGEERAGEDENGIPIRRITDMTFSEVSIVAFPAYPATSVAVAQRSMQAVVVSERSMDFFRTEMFGKGMPLDLARKIHKTRLAR